MLDTPHIIEKFLSVDTMRVIIHLGTVYQEVVVGQDIWIHYIFFCYCLEGRQCSSLYVSIRLHAVDEIVGEPDGIICEPAVIGVSGGGSV